jgi:hypothetical protein
VQFITASEAAKLYKDKALDRKFTKDDVRAIAAGVNDGISFQRRDGYALSPSEVFYLLNRYLVERGAGKDSPEISWKNTLLGPSSASQPFTETVSIDWSQLTRTAADVDDALGKQDRVPGTIWLGSVAIPPEVYLRGLARVVLDVLDGKDPPKTVEFAPAKLDAAKYVAADDPKLWGWVIFPPGFQAPALMELAKRQAWTLKPALLDKTRE